MTAGNVSEQRLLSMDLYPTLLEVAGLAPKDAIEGRSFLPELLNGTQTVAERPLYFTRREGGTLYGGQSIYAVRLGDWKLLQNSSYEGYELYNLKEDPLEENNLIEQELEKYRELNKLLMLHIQKGGQVPWQKPEE